MLLAVVVFKSLIEMSVMIILGRAILGWMTGNQRGRNVFWQLLDVAARPALWLTRSLSPKAILDRHIPLAATGWLMAAWLLTLRFKLALCSGLAATACR